MNPEEVAEWMIARLLIEQRNSIVNERHLVACSGQTVDEFLQIPKLAWILKRRTGQEHGSKLGELHCMANL